MSLYEDPAQQGRRGVLDVGESVRIVHKKVDEKAKFLKFTQKFGSGLDVKAA